MFEALFGWKKMSQSPNWINKTSKMIKAHHIATHQQIPGTTRTYHLKGKNNIYRIKVRSTGQYALHTVYSKRRKR